MKASPDRHASRNHAPAPRQPDHSRSRNRERDRHGLRPGPGSGQVEGRGYHHPEGNSPERHLDGHAPRGWPGGTPLLPGQEPS
jgi:hypothetical protein